MKITGEFVFFVIFVMAISVVPADGSDFASEVISSSKGPFGASPYDDPEAVLGKPTTWIKKTADEIFACSLVYSAWNTAPDGSKLVVTLGIGSEIVVAFDHKVADDAGNPYGIDFIVFGNALFGAESVEYFTPDTDMDDYMLKDPLKYPTGLFSEWVTVSVAQDPNGSWYSFADGPWYSARDPNGPHADDLFPTNAFAWDSEGNTWADEQDWLKPVDPNLGLSDFSGLSVADAIGLYDGSAGGTGFDLKRLSPEDYEALEIDPVSGQRWIQYVKVTSDEFGEVDGFSDVACCGDYQHPYPTGDINKDCRVDMFDLALIAGNWLLCTWDCQ